MPVTINLQRPERFEMTQTSNRFFDEIGRLMNDAAGAAQGVKREVDTVVRNQAERILRDLDLVKREEFDAVKDMARLAREENEALKGRIAALEAKLGISPAAPDAGSTKTGRVGDFHHHRHGRVHSRPSTFFVAAARTWMPGIADSYAVCVAAAAGHDGFGAVIGPKPQKTPFISLSFRPFGAKSPPRPQPPHPWRLAVGRQRAAMRPLTF